MQKLSIKQKRIGLMVILPVICLIASVGDYEHAYAQDVSSLSNISGQQVGALVAIGLIAVTFQAYQGWSTSGEKFVPKAFLDRILLGAVHSIWMSIVAAASYPALTPMTYILVFLGTVGATELTMKQLSAGSSSQPGPQDLPVPPPSSTPSAASVPQSSTVPAPAPQTKTIQVGDTILQKEN